MKIIAAYMLAILGGNPEPTVEDIKRILGSIDARADDARIELLVSQLRGKNVFELIEQGKEKLAFVEGQTQQVPCQGGKPDDENEKEEVYDTDSEKSDGGSEPDIEFMGGGLFGDDDDDDW